MARSNFVDLTGRRFERLLVIGKSDRTYADGRILWSCQCDCGKTTESSTSHLNGGKVRSCGCLQREIAKQVNTTHGDKSNLYAVWIMMRERCGNPNNKNYDRYGGRGITVCEEWDKSYPAFKEWAIAHGYQKGLTIDRKDNDKGYSPDNCQWATRRSQARNTSINRIVEAWGEKKSLAEWAEDVRASASYDTIRRRLDLGWQPEKAIGASLKNQTLCLNNA